MTSQGSAASAPTARRQRLTPQASAGARRNFILLFSVTYLGPCRCIVRFGAPRWLVFRLSKPPQG